MKIGACYKVQWSECLKGKNVFTSIDENVLALEMHKIKECQGKMKLSTKILKNGKTGSTPSLPFFFIRD